MDERPRLSEWVESWKRTRSLQVRHKTELVETAMLRSRILPAFGDWPLDRIGRADVARWRDTVASEAGIATAQRALAVLRAVLRTAVEYGILDENPAERTRPVRCSTRLVVPSARDVCRAIGRLGRYEHRVAAAVAATSGLRWGEQFALRTRDVVRIADRLALVVERQRPAGLRDEAPPKTRAGERLVPVWQGLEDHVLHMCRKDGEGLLWVGERGGPVSYGWWRRVWARACRDAGVRIRWHDLRHHAASLWIACGWDVASVAACLGHSSPAVTLRIYVRQFREKALGSPFDQAAFTRMLLDTVELGALSCA